MKVAISASGKTLDSEVNPRLGRCEYFIVYNMATGEQSVIENTGRFSQGSAGIATAKLLNDQQVDAVITGNVGPNALSALAAAGIVMYTGATGKVSEMVEKFKLGQLTEAKFPNVGPHGR